MDPFVVLGIEPTTSEVLIRAAYRRRARVVHPDVRAGRGAPGERAHEDFCRLDEALRLALVSARYAVNEPRPPSGRGGAHAAVPRQRGPADVRVPGQRSAPVRPAPPAAARTTRAASQPQAEWSAPLLVLVVGLVALLAAIVLTTPLPSSLGL